MSDERGDWGKLTFCPSCGRLYIIGATCVCDQPSPGITKGSQYARDTREDR